MNKVMSPCARDAPASPVFGSPTFARSTEEFDASETHVPRKLMMKLRGAGAEVTRGCGITLIELGGCTAAIEILYGWAATLGPEDDPLLSVSRCPSLAVELECCSILASFSQLSAAQFENMPVLQPHGNPPTDVRFNHCQMSLSAVASFLQNPGPRFAAIHALVPGQLVCKLRQVWARGTTITLHVVKT